MMFTIIVPVYNTELYLPVCIESILSQTYVDFELILVDDGSSDGSGQICDKYKTLDERVAVIHKGNGGLPSARNAGIEIAKGDYIVFIDSDDVILRNTMQILYQSAQETDADIIQFGIQKVTSDNNLEKAHSNDVEVFHILSEYTAHESLKSFYKDGAITTTVCNKIYKRDFLCNKRFDNKARYFAEDVLFLSHVLWDVKKVVNIDYPGYLYRTTPNSMVTIGLNRNKFESSMYAYISNKCFFRDKDNELFCLSDAFLCSALLNWRIRKRQITDLDKRAVSKKIKKYIRQNIRDFIKNGQVSLKYKLLLGASCVSIHVIDVYNSFALIKHS